MFCYPVLINGVFNLIFTENILKQLKTNAMENLDKYLETINDILNNSKLGLNEETKKNNKTTINKIYTSFKNDNKKLIKEIHEEKSEEYKKENNFEKFEKMLKI